MAKNQATPTATEKDKPVAGPKQQEWLDSAKPKEVTIDGQKLYLEPKLFSTGSVGYGLSGKLQLPHGEVIDRVQVSANLTVIGSKEW